MAGRSTRGTSMRRPSTDYPARPCCSIVAGPGNLLVWTPPCRRPHDGADRAGRGAVTFAPVPGIHRPSMAAGPSGAGSSKGLRCLRKTTAAARDLRSPTRKRCCSTAKAVPASSKWWPPSRWRPSAICRSPIRPASQSRAGDRGGRDRAYDYTTKGNFVAVITNGTAILGSEIAARWRQSR